MTRPLPSDCRTMTELRALIDGIDDELFELFAERMACIHRAAEIKARDGIPANVPSRVAEVVENAKARARARGLEPELYGRFWEAIVASAIASEESRLGGEKA